MRWIIKADIELEAENEIKAHNKVVMIFLRDLPADIDWRVGEVVVAEPLDPPRARPAQIRGKPGVGGG